MLQAEEFGALLVRSRVLGTEMYHLDAELARKHHRELHCTVRNRQPDGWVSTYEMILDAWL